MPNTKNISRFIINPISGKGKNSKIPSLIEKYLDHTKFDPEICLTQGQGDATRLSKEANEKGIPLVVAVGGDGTVHEVGKALIGSNTTLGIIPTGSGNGLARHLNIPGSPIEAIELLNRMTISTIDTVKINGDYFLNMAGIGFDAHIAKKFSEYQKRGFWSYLKLVFREFFSYEPQDYTLTIDGKNLSQKAFLISFANSSQYGNNIRISPHAKINDGFLDITILSPFPKKAIPLLCLQLLTSCIHHSKYHQIILGKEVFIEGSQIHLDGEPIDLGSKMHLELLPASLKLATP